jgi:hypothetical protein
MSNSVVFGVFSTKEQVETAVNEMKSQGFRNADISVLFPYNEGSKDFALEKGTKAPEGAAAGATSGGVIGGALGWLAGIGMLAIPGLGPFIAAGPIMALLGGVGVGAAVGGLTGALIGMGIPEYVATRYEGRIKGGCILLSVHADDSCGSRKQRRFSNIQAQTTSHRLENPKAIMRIPTGPADRKSA